MAIDAKQFSTRDAVDALRLDEHQREQLLQLLKTQQREQVGFEGRTALRHRFEKPTPLVVVVFHPNKTSTRYLVTPRNVSTSGIGFLHGGYLHPGTRCVIMAAGAGGGRILEPGVIVRCRYLSGRIHDVGLQFANAVDPAWFVRTHIDQPDQNTAAATAATPLRFRGRLIIAEPTKADRTRLRQHCIAMNVKATMTNSAEDIMGLLAEDASFDLLITADQLEGGACGYDLCRQLAKQHASLPTIIMPQAAQSDDDHAVHRKAAEHGCRGILNKPINEKTLSDLLLQHLPLDEAA